MYGVRIRGFGGTVLGSGWCVRASLMNDSLFFVVIPTMQEGEMIRSGLFVSSEGFVLLEPGCWETVKWN